MPKSPGKVRPLGASARLSIALFSDSVMRGFEAWVIFSTPTAIAASVNPAPTARHAWRNAMPPEAHAPSTLVHGNAAEPDRFTHEAREHLLAGEHSRRRSCRGRVRRCARARCRRPPVRHVRRPRPGRRWPASS